MPDRPNLLLITTDQQRFDTLHAAGNPAIYTPHLNWLCDSGIRYSRGYSDCPVCAPGIDPVDGQPLYAGPPGGWRMEYQNLPAGTYTARATADPSQPVPATFAYQLKVSATPSPAPGADEPNDDPAHATALVPGTHAAVLHSYADVDWYFVRIDATSNLQISHTAWNPVGAGATIGLYHDADPNTPIAVGEWYANGPPSFENDQLPIRVDSLAPGDYLVRLGGDYWRDPYEITLDVAPVIKDAFESDDTPATARWLLPGQTQDRSLHDGNDVDWAKFVLAESSSVELGALAPELGWNMRRTLYAAGHLDAPIDARAVLLPGTYYVAIDGWTEPLAGSAYSLTLRHRPASIGVT